MEKSTKAVRVAKRAIIDLLNVNDEDVLIVADHASMAENESIINAMIGISQERGATTNLVVIENIDTDTQSLPEMAEKAMETCDVLIGITMTTAASAVHHPTPEALKDEGELRSMIMVKRSFEALTSPAVLNADYSEMTTIAKKMRKHSEAGSNIRLTSELGTDLEASIEDRWAGRTDVAHEAGEQSLISWGEVYQGPVVGTAEGKAVIDGPILGYGWPPEPVEVEIEEGNVKHIRGDEKIVGDLTENIENHENGENIAEIAFGINPEANQRTTNIWKKGLGRTHIAVGSGLFYGQSIDSPIHIDMIMNESTVEIDGKTIIEEGELSI